MLKITIQLVLSIFTCCDLRVGFELSGVGLNRGQWKALVETSRGDGWAPKYISLDSFDDLNKTLGSADYQSYLRDNTLVESKHNNLPSWKDDG